MTRKLPAKSLSERLPGLAFVVLLHFVLGWALLNGLARKAAEQVLKEPLEVALLEEPKPAVIAPPEAPPAEPDQPAEPEPPVEPKPPAPPPKPPRPRAARVPSPEVAVTVPAVAAAPAAQPETAPRSATAPIVAIGMACPNHIHVRSSVPYPGRAERRGLEGQVVAEFTVSVGGAIENVRIASSSNAIFNEAVLQAVRRFQCIGQRSAVRVRVPFEFILK